jgi:hypothetical protein
MATESLRQGPYVGRTAGIVLLIATAVDAFLGILRPIWDAAHHSASVPLMMKATLITPMIFGLGVIYSVFGQKASSILGPRDRPSKLGWVVYI